MAEKKKVDKGKSLANVTSSATKLLQEISSGTGVAMEISELTGRIDNSSKGGSSFIPAASVLRMQEWTEIIAQQAELPQPSTSTGLRSPQNVNDVEWANWENPIDNFEINNFIGVPMHFHKQDTDFEHSFVDNSHREQESDGDEIIKFLNLNFYTSEIYDPVDHDRELFSRNSRMQFESTALNDFLDAPDILTYLTQTRYTYDVYGLPTFLRNSIKEAKDEIINGNNNAIGDSSSEAHNRTAVERLMMVRNHLIQMRGNPGESERVVGRV